ncbi:hypothetical protein VB715_04900 [Crocosphaera sp. UHCC 0190]|uniref:hypothetical protein n=1 Tax=Crocosphaera sp. UHCC 0190 TaxID=3110246 RepID=UPI002B216196|nr:hypothetical protein [Crocosphaera sp. UHCC 0190]MEA5509096.1 hypothetical protein [Crocosphaera sp. UHCC 0190]
MSQPKPSSSSFRYFVAGLKPLGRVNVWVPLGIVALVALSLWQYSRHPEWLIDNASDNFGETGDEVGNNLDIGVNLQNLPATTDQIPLNPNSLNADTPQPPGELPLNNPLGVPNLQNSLLPNGSVDPLNPQPSAQTAPENSQRKQSPQFQPLIPNFKDLGSLFPSMSPSKSSSQPIKLPDLEPLKIGTNQDNPLKNALDDVFSQESPALESNPSPGSVGESIPTLPRQPQRTFQTPSNVRRSSPTPAPQPYTNSPAPSYNSPYSNPQSQPYQSPYNNPYSSSPPQPYSNPYGNGMAPAPIPAYPQPSQSGNGYNQPNYPVQPYQAPQQNQYGMQAPQVDEYEGSYSY